MLINVALWFTKHAAKIAGAKDEPSMDEAKEVHKCLRRAAGIFKYIKENVGRLLQVGERWRFYVMDDICLSYFTWTLIISGWRQKFGFGHTSVERLLTHVHCRSSRSHYRSSRVSKGNILLCKNLILVYFVPYLRKLLFLQILVYLFLVCFLCVFGILFHIQEN